MNALIQAEQPTLFKEFEDFGLELVSHGYLATMELALTLLDQIKEAQKDHESIEGIRKKIPLDKAPGFSEDAEGVLRYHGRVCVPNVKELKKLILKEAHDTPYSIHPGGTKITKIFVRSFGAWDEAGNWLLHSQM